MDQLFQLCDRRVLRQKKREELSLAFHHGRIYIYILIALFSVFCLCACVGDVYTIMGKKAGNTQNRQHKTTDIPNPTVGAHPEVVVTTVSAQVSFVVVCCLLLLLPPLLLSIELIRNTTHTLSPFL